MKLILNSFGQTLGVNKDSFIIKKNGEVLATVPFYKINEIVASSKNLVSVDALLWASLYNVDVVFTLRNGKPLAFLHSIKDKEHVKTRLNQFKAYETMKGLEIAKTLVIQKIENENALLKHLNLKSYDQKTELPKIEKIEGIEGEKITQSIRLKLNTIEQHFSAYFYEQTFSLFPKWMRVEKRIHPNATDPLNNLLNLSYEVLEWKILKAVLKAKLDPYLGFLHSIQYGKPSLVCDLIEPFRPYIMNFLIPYAKKLSTKDFKKAYIKNQYPRYFLKHETAWKLIEALNKQLFESHIPIQRNRKHGSTMQFETFIDEYTSQIAQTINKPDMQMPKTHFPPYTKP